MSEQHRTPKEYTERYATQYCDGNQEEAEEHEMVKEVCKELKEENVSDERGDNN